MNRVNLNDPALLRWRAGSDNQLTLALLPEHAAMIGRRVYDDDLEYLRTLPYIARQLKKLDKKLVAEEVGEWFEWDTSNHETNLTRLLWLAAGALTDDWEGENENHHET